MCEFFFTIIFTFFVLIIWFCLKIESFDTNWSENLSKSSTWNMMKYAIKYLWIIFLLQIYVDLILLFQIDQFVTVLTYSINSSSIPTIFTIFQYNSSNCIALTPIKFYTENSPDKSHIVCVQEGRVLFFREINGSRAELILFKCIHLFCIYTQIYGIPATVHAARSSEASVHTHTRHIFPIRIRKSADLSHTRTSLYTIHGNLFLPKPSATIRRELWFRNDVTALAVSHAIIARFHV